MFESHLDSTQPLLLEVFPQGYTVIRKDHCYEKCGVFLCSRENLLVVEQSSLISDAEAIAIGQVNHKTKPYLYLFLLLAT